MWTRLGPSQRWALGRLSGQVSEATRLRPPPPSVGEGPPSRCPSPAVGGGVLSSFRAFVKALWGDPDAGVRAGISAPGTWARSDLGLLPGLWIQSHREVVMAAGGEPLGVGKNLALMEYLEAAFRE